MRSPRPLDERKFGASGGLLGGEDFGFLGEGAHQRLGLDDEAAEDSEERKWRREEYMAQIQRLSDEEKWAMLTNLSNAEVEKSKKEPIIVKVPRFTAEDAELLGKEEEGAEETMTRGEYVQEWAELLGCPPKRCVCVYVCLCTYYVCMYTHTHTHTHT